ESGFQTSVAMKERPKVRKAGKAPWISATMTPPRISRTSSANRKVSERNTTSPITPPRRPDAATRSMNAVSAATVCHSILRENLDWEKIEPRQDPHPARCARRPLPRCGRGASAPDLKAPLPPRGREGTKPEGLGG